MPNSEYNYTDKDFELIANTKNKTDINDYKKSGVYFRIIVINNFTNQVLTLNQNRDAIFYSSMAEDSNGNPIQFNVNEINSRGQYKSIPVGGNQNQFKVYVKDVSANCL